MVAAVDLHQHALLWHAPAPEPVLLGTAAARTADAGLDQNPAHRGAAQVDALALPQQLGEVAVVGPRIAVAGQLHHGSGGRLRDGVVRSSAPVPMGQCGGTVPAVSREETLGVAFAHSHDLGGLRDGKLVFQNTAEYLNPCLFLLIQRYIPHGDDCDDVSGPSRLGSDPGDDRPKCLNMICRPGLEMAHRVSTALASSVLIGAWPPAPSQS